MILWSGSNWDRAVAWSCCVLMCALPRTSQSNPFLLSFFCCRIGRGWCLLFALAWLNPGEVATVLQCCFVHNVDNKITISLYNVICTPNGSFFFLWKFWPNFSIWILNRNLMNFDEFLLFLQLKNCPLARVVMIAIFETVAFVKTSAKFCSVGIQAKDVISPLSMICFILPMSFKTMGDLQVSFVVKTEETTWWLSQNTCVLRSFSGMLVTSEIMSLKLMAISEAYLRAIASAS